MLVLFQTCSSENQKCTVALPNETANDTMQNLTVKIFSKSGNGVRCLQCVHVTVTTAFDRSLSKTNVGCLRVEGSVAFISEHTHKVNS